MRHSVPLALSHRPTNGDDPALPPIRETDLDRILKLIPTELLALYIAAVPVITEIPWRYAAFALLVAGTACTPVLLYVDGRSTRQAARWPQYIVRTLAFVAWANAILWPFSPWISERELAWMRSLAVLLVPLVGGFVLRDRPPAAPPV